MSAVLQEQPQFRSVDDALRFAFARYQYEHYERTSLARMAGGPQPEGKGLTGLDGAHTVGTIYVHLATIGQLWRRILIARYTPRDVVCICLRPCCAGTMANPPWMAEVDWITASLAIDYSCGVTDIHLRKACVLKYFGKRVQIQHIAEFCRIHVNTASQHNNKIVTFLKAEEKSAYSAMDERLRSAGLII